MSFKVYNSPTFSDIKTNNITAFNIDSTSINTSSITESNIVQTQTFDISSNEPQVNLFSIDTTQKYGLGSRYSYNGAVYRYCQIINNSPASGLTYDARNLVGTEQISTTNTITLASDAILNGAHTVTLLLADNVTENQLKNYTTYVNDGGFGQDNIVVSHPAGLAGQKIVFTLLFQTYAAPATVSVTFRRNPWVISPFANPPQQNPLGVLLYSVPLNVTGYVWIQTYGLTSARQSPDTGVPSNILQVGNAVVPGRGTYGRVMAPRTDTAGDCNLPIIGTCVVDVPGAGNMAYIFLTISN